MLLTATRRSIENPSISLQDPEAWAELFGSGSLSDSGVRVTPKMALGYSAWWRGLVLVSTAVGKLPLVTYKRLGQEDDAGKEKDREHAAFKLLRYRPSPFYSAGIFKETLTAHAMAEGNGYGFIVRNRDKTPKEMLILDPFQTFPVRANGLLWYVTRIGAEDRKLKPSDVLHIRGLGFDGLIGYPVRQIAADSLGLGIAARQNGSAFMRNASRPSVVLEHPKAIGTEAANNLRASWERMASGLENAHRTAVLEEGAKATVLSVNAKDAQQVETREHQIREVANFVGVPPHKLGDPARTSFKSLEQEEQAFLNDGLDIWLVRWEEEGREKLLSERERETDSHVIEFTRNALVRADLPARGTFYASAVGGPYMLADEARARENMAPLPDGQGATLAPPPNQSVPADDDDPSSDTDGDTDEDDDESDDLEEDERQAQIRSANEALLADRVGFLARRIGRDAQREAKTPETFCDWLDGELEARHRGIATESLRPVVDVLQASEVGKMSGVDVFADSLLRSARERLELVVETHSKEFLSVGVAQEVDNWPNGLEVRYGTTISEDRGGAD